MNKEFVSRDLIDLSALVNDILQHLGEARVVCMQGSMGAGKTTLVKHMIHELGAIDSGSSPTFSLINEYHSENHGKIYHLDLFRLNSLEEALDIGVEDVIEGKYWCFIEWPEVIDPLLPELHATVAIKALPDGTRIVSLKN